MEIELNQDGFYDLNGTLYRVELSIYNSSYPEINDGIFEEYLFDEQVEAENKLEDILVNDTRDWEEILNSEPDYSFDTIGILIRCEEYIDGICQDDFFDSTIIVEPKILAAR